MLPQGRKPDNNKKSADKPNKSQHDQPAPEGGNAGLPYQQGLNLFSASQRNEGGKHARTADGLLILC